MTEAQDGRSGGSGQGASVTDTVNDPSHMRPKKKRWWTRAKAVVALIAGIVAALVAMLAFPQKLQEAYDASVQTLARTQRPVLALWYKYIGDHAGKALELIRRLHPGANVCMVKNEMTDLTGDGWNADIFIVYGPKPTDSSIPCESPDAPRPSLAVFMFRDFRFRHAGTETSDDLPSDWSAKDGLLLRETSGTDFPTVDIWYVYNGSLVHSDVTIALTDNSEHEYELHTQKYDHGVIAWGTPDGLFHMEVAPDGKFVKEAGLPKELDRVDKHALELRWSGEAFVNSAGEEWPPDEFKDSVVKIGPLSHLYVSGCEASEGFALSPDFPGAVIPLFDQHPKLLCGGTNEDDVKVILVERKD